MSRLHYTPRLTTISAPLDLVPARSFHSRVRLWLHSRTEKLSKIPQKHYYTHTCLGYRLHLRHIEVRSGLEYWAALQVLKPCFTDGALQEGIAVFT